MNNKYSETQFYVDCLIIEALASESSFVKTADDGAGVSSLISSVKNYFSQHIDENNPGSSVLAMLAPAAIYAALRGFSPKLAFALAVASSVFGVDVKNAIASIYDYVKDIINENKKVTSKNIEEVVNRAVDQNSKSVGSSTPAPTPSPTPTARRAPPSGGFDLTGSDFSLQDAYLVSLALNQYRRNNITKYALGPAAITKSGLFKNAIKKILFWVFTTALSSAGFLVAGDVVNSVIGRPSALTGTLKAPMSQPTASQAVAAVSAGPKPPIKSNYVSGRYNELDSLWEIRLPATQQNMQDTIVDFLREVYSGLDDKPGSNEKYNVIVNTSSFGIVLQKFMQENRSLMRANTTMFFVPFMFKNKKNVADMIIVEAAKDLKDKKLITL